MRILSLGAPLGQRVAVEELVRWGQLGKVDHTIEGWEVCVTNLLFYLEELSRVLSRFQLLIMPF